MAVDFDVTSLHHRRATHRWERTSVGDPLERMTWSFPDQEALIGREGAYADPALRRLTYRQPTSSRTRSPTPCWPAAWTTATW